MFQKESHSRRKAVQRRGKIRKMENVIARQRKGVRNYS
jgi:hypothetical protein